MFNTNKKKISIDIDKSLLDSQNVSNLGENEYLIVPVKKTKGNSIKKDSSKTEFDILSEYLKLTNKAQTIWRSTENDSHKKSEIANINNEIDNLNKQISSKLEKIIINNDSLIINETILDKQKDANTNDYLAIMKYLKPVKADSFYNKKQLQFGIKIEMEHVNPNLPKSIKELIATVITKNHLDESPIFNDFYYSYLKLMENELHKMEKQAELEQKKDSGLSIEQIKELSSRPKVKKIAVENFLMSVDTSISYEEQLKNIELDKNLYKWKQPTVDAITEGLKLIYNEISNKKAITEINEEDEKFYAEVKKKYCNRFDSNCKGCPRKKNCPLETHLL